MCQHFDANWKPTKYCNCKTQTSFALHNIIIIIQHKPTWLSRFPTVHTYVVLKYTVHVNS
jgi:hypothetical protein